MSGSGDLDAGVLELRRDERGDRLGTCTANCYRNLFLVWPNDDLYRFSCQGDEWDAHRGQRRRPWDDAHGRAAAAMTEGKAPLRIVLADDAILLREALAAALAASGFEVVGQAADVPELLALVERTRPDVIVVDVRMPPTHTTEGLEAARTIRAERPGTAVLVLSQYVETRYAVDLLRDDPAGIGYLLKDHVARLTDLADAVRRVAAGDSVIDPEVVARLLGRHRRHSDRRADAARTTDPRADGRGTVEPGYRGSTGVGAEDDRGPRRGHLLQAVPRADERESPPRAGGARLPPGRAMIRRRVGAELVRGGTTWDLWALRA